MATLKARSAHSRALIGQQAVELADLQRRLARQAAEPMQRIEAARTAQPGRVAAIFDNLATALTGSSRAPAVLQPDSFLLQYLGDALGTGAGWGWGADRLMFSAMSPPACADELAAGPQQRGPGPRGADFLPLPFGRPTGRLAAAAVAVASCLGVLLACLLACLPLGLHVALDQSLIDLRWQPPKARRLRCPGGRSGSTFPGRFRMVYWPPIEFSGSKQI